MIHFFAQNDILIDLIGKRTIVRVTNMFEKAHYKQPICQGLIFRVLLEIETRVKCFV